jgi:xenotropic and polytropic retrovirus receptor 1
VYQSFFLPALSILPFYWRLMQELRKWRDTKNFSHVINGLKYVLSGFTTLMGISVIYWPHNDYVYLALFISFVFLSVFCSMINFLWDVKFDWELFQNVRCNPFRTRNWLLRNNLLYWGKFRYYIAIILNFIFRFGNCLYFLLRTTTIILTLFSFFFWLQ